MMNILNYIHIWLACVAILCAGERVIFEASFPTYIYICWEGDSYIVCLLFHNIGLVHRRKYAQYG